MFRADENPTRKGSVRDERDRRQQVSDNRRVDVTTDGACSSCVNAAPRERMYICRAMQHMPHYPHTVLPHLFVHCTMAPG